MFSFWSRKGNKSPAAGRSANIGQDVELSTSTVPRPVQVDPSVQAGLQADTNIVPEATVAVVDPNPHDAAISEVHAKLLQAEQLSSKSTTYPSSTAADPLTEPLHPHLPNPSSEVLYDPATGAQRGTFEPAMTAGSCDSEQLRDEAWTHLARIREIQSEIAMMHVHMESIGDGADTEVDNDVDVDTVPTQEEEDAAKKEKEFERLPGKFKGRSDNIHAMMAKVRLTAFHSLFCIWCLSLPTPFSSMNCHRP